MMASNDEGNKWIRMAGRLFCHGWQFGVSFVTLDKEGLDSMATLHIEIPDQKVAALKAYAQQGLTVE
jgi:hypothetical protein